MGCHVSVSQKKKKRKVKIQQISNIDLLRLIFIDLCKNLKINSKLHFIVTFEINMIPKYRCIWSENEIKVGFPYTCILHFELKMNVYTYKCIKLHSMILIK